MKSDIVDAEGVEAIGGWIPAKERDRIEALKVTVAELEEELNG
jgi:hypothetical protein